MRTVAVAVAILSSCLMQEVSGSVFLGKDAPKAGAALLESTKHDKEAKVQHKQPVNPDASAAEKARAKRVLHAHWVYLDDISQHDIKQHLKVEVHQDKQESEKEAKARYKRVLIGHEALKESTKDDIKHYLRVDGKVAQVQDKKDAKPDEAEMLKAEKAHKEALKKMSETNGAPSQGFNEHSDKTVNVEHDDMKTQASDWGGEWPQTDETDAEAKARICRTQEVQSKWCKDLGFASLLERESMAITPMEDSYDPDSDANNPENPEHRHDQEVHGGDFFQSVHHTWDDVDPSTMAMDRVSSDAEQRAVNHEFLAPHNQYDAPMSFLQTSQSSQPREKTALEEYQDNQIAEGLQEAELLPRVADIATDDQ